ncbi:MAG: hypothetical protein M5R36_20955 [Deltaproteobacteria bacterium]|nr:hypothetical protein [Deltaproteobacteria bacterium]
MKVSLNWIKDFAAIGDTAKIPDLLLKAGLEVEDVRRVGEGVAGIVTAKILSVEPHPNADKLKVCIVDDGSAERTVVCGAPNAAAHTVALLAAPGAALPGGRVEKRPIRGVESHGMLLSKSELGVSEDHSGLWYMPGGIAPGSSFEEEFPYADIVFTIDVTANRPDLLCMIGVAREIAALTGERLKKLDIPIHQRGRGDRSAYERRDCRRRFVPAIHRPSR